MRILVTGGAGYIGSHIVRKLHERGDEITVLDSLELGHRQAVPGEVKLEIGDIGDEKLVTRIAGEFKPEAVIHLAGYIQVGESVKLPDKYFENNIVKSGRMLQILINHGVKKLIFSSTAAVYGNPVKVPIEEDAPKSPTNPYGLSKWWFEQLLDYCDQIYGLRSIRLRFFNACGAASDGQIGEDHKPESHIIPKAMEAAITGQEFNLFGTDYPTPDGTCVRDYIHVEDLAAAHIAALEALGKGHKTDYFNVGTGKGYSNRQILQTVEKVTGKKLVIKEMPKREGDAAELVAEVTKIKKELGWTAKCSDLETIVLTAWKWHQNHPSGYGSSKQE